VKGGRGGEKGAASASQQTQPVLRQSEQ
jgi:hypothetical protein